MDIYEALYTTRAMRRVKPDPIPLEVQRRILDAAVRAPSGGNAQNWRFLLVDDADVKAAIGPIYREGIATLPELEPTAEGPEAMVARVEKAADWILSQGKLPAVPPRLQAPATDDGREARLAARSAELDRRERDLAAREAAHAGDGDTGENALELERRARAVEEHARAVAAREQELAEREAAVAQREAVPPDPDGERLAQIEKRLAALKQAEAVFLRTREELAARSEAVAARERLAAQLERELDERVDGTGPFTKPELTELEARLRRLEQGGSAGEQTLGFSGGFRKLQHEGTRPRRRRA